MRGEDGDQPAGAGEVQRFDEEVVVQAVPAGVVRGSCSTILPNGTLPMVRSKLPAGSRVSAKDSARISAWGLKAAAIAAVIGSSSTPTS